MLAVILGGAEGLFGLGRTNGRGELLEGGDAEPRHVDGICGLTGLKSGSGFVNKVTEDGSGLSRRAFFVSLPSAADWMDWCLTFGASTSVKGPKLQACFA